MSLAFGVIEIDFVVVSTCGATVGVSLSTNTYLVSSTVFVPSVVTIFISYHPVSVTKDFSSAPLFSSCSSYLVTIVTTGSLGIIGLTGPVTVTVVVPSSAGVTFTLMSVLITFDVSNMLGVVSTISPSSSPSVSFVTSKIPISILFVLTSVGSDSTGPFPSLSVACVFT